MAYDITRLILQITNLKSRADDLSYSIIYRENELEDLGINNQWILGNEIEHDLITIVKSLEVSKAKLDSITYGKGPTGYGPTGYGLLARSPWGP